MTSRSIRWRFYAYMATTSMGFYLPVNVVYLLDQGYGVGFVALSQATFSIALLLAELPTGYVGDRLGRRASLAVGNALLFGGVAGYVVADSAGGYLFLKVLVGTGWAFRSGTRDAWLYELLDAHDDTDEFARVSGRGRTSLLLTSAVGAALGGVLYGVDPGLPFLATGTTGALSLPILATFPPLRGVGTESVGREADSAPAGPTDDALSVREALATLRRQVSRPAVRWVVAYTVLLFLVFDLSRTFEQPALDSLGVPIAGMGVLYAGFKLVSAGAASTTGWLTDRLGVRRTLALAAPVVGLAYAAILVLPLATVPVLFLYRSARTVLQPVRDQYLNDHLADVGRATVLSGASMVLSLAGVGARLAGGAAAEVVGPVTVLAAAGVALSGTAGLLWLTVSPAGAAEVTAPESAGAD